MSSNATDASKSNEPSTEQPEQDVFVGILQFELLIRQSRSLKDKRRVVRSVRDRLHREHLVSIAETTALDHQQLAVMGVSLVANSAAYINTVFDTILNKLRSLREAELGETTRTILSGDNPPAQLDDMGCSHPEGVS